MKSIPNLKALKFCTIEISQSFLAFAINVTIKTMKYLKMKELLKY